MENSLRAKGSSTGELSQKGPVHLVVVARPVEGEAVGEELLEVVAGEGLPAEKTEDGIPD